MAAKPEPSLVAEQLEALQTMLKAWGPKMFLQSMCWILPKKSRTLSSGQRATLIPFRYNRIQDAIEEKLGRRNLLLKPRQIGGTVYFSLRRLLLPAITTKGFGALLISQSNEYVEKHFRIINRAYRYFAMEEPYGQEGNDLAISLHEHLMHTKASNRRELLFDQLESTIMVASAEVEEAAQGVTLHAVLADEYSRWPGSPEDTLSNVAGALVPDGTLDKNCTANGAQGPFYEDCLRALNDPKTSDAILHFFGWWWETDYESKLTPKQAKTLEQDLQADEKAIIKKIKLELKEVTWHQSMEKIAWRRRAKLEQRANFDEKFPEDVITAFLVSGKHYFDREILIARKMELVGFKPFQTFANGEAKLFQARVPGRRYVIGADPASGKDIGTDTDYCAAVVLDLETGEEMAAYRAKTIPADFAYDLDDLGRYYNNAMVAVERTGDGGTVILVLVGECKYGAIFKFKEWHRRERKFVEFEGFPTTSRTRPVALNMLNRFVRDHPERLWDEQFINEALVFVRDPKRGIPAAAPGSHDDTVACRWIAHMARLVLLGYWQPAESRHEGYVAADRLTDETEVEEVTS